MAETPFTPSPPSTPDWLLNAESVERAFEAAGKEDLREPAGPKRGAEHNVGVSPTKAPPAPKNRHGKFILSGKDKIQLFAPPIAKLIIYIFWFWWWTWWWWPALILGFVWVVALYEVREDGQGNSTGHLVEDSGAWRPGACSWTRSTFHKTVYLHKNKETYGPHVGSR